MSDRATAPGAVLLAAIPAAVRPGRGAPVGVVGSSRPSGAVRPGDRAARVLSAYAGLSKQVQDAGLLQRRRGFYWARISIGLAAFAGIWVGFAVLGNSWYQLLLAAAFSVVITQFAFLGHDGAHRQIFSSFRWNEWTGRVFAGLFAGLGYSWWMAKHSRHHQAPNQLDKDTDIESAAMSLTERAQRARGRLSARLLRHQGWLFFVLLPFEGLNLHVDSYRRSVARGPVKRRWVDLVFTTVRLGVYVAVLAVFLPPGKAVAFFAVQMAVFGVCMGGAFAPNHTGMPIVAVTAKLDFLRRQVLMSRNISGGAGIDFIMGGLNHQIEHHLFPSMPRPNLRRAQPMVRAFCADHGIAYTETTLAGSYRDIVRYLNTVGAHARDPFSCPLLAQYRL
jgi:fatty acid desaturase